MDNEIQLKVGLPPWGNFSTLRLLTLLLCRVLLGKLWRTTRPHRDVPVQELLDANSANSVGKPGVEILELHSLQKEVRKIDDLWFFFGRFVDVNTLRQTANLRWFAIWKRRVTPIGSSFCQSRPLGWKRSCNPAGDPGGEKLILPNYPIRCCTRVFWHPKWCRILYIEWAFVWEEKGRYDVLAAK